MVPWWLCLLAFFLGFVVAGVVCELLDCRIIPVPLKDELMEAERQKAAVEEQLERMRKAGW